MECFFSLSCLVWVSSQSLKWLIWQCSCQNEIASGTEIFQLFYNKMVKGTTASSWPKCSWSMFQNLLSHYFLLNWKWLLQISCPNRIHQLFTGDTCISVLRKILYNLVYLAMQKGNVQRTCFVNRYYLLYTCFASYSLSKWIWIKKLLCNPLVSFRRLSSKAAWWSS